MSEGKEPDRTASLLIDGLGIPESVRWHQGQVWLCNWGAGEVLAIAPSGARRAITRLAPHSFPFSIDWLPDGRLLVVDGPRRRLLVSEADGTLTVYAELSRLGDGVANELVVDSAGNAFVNGGERAVLRVSPDGVVRKVADGLRFPNGMAITDRGQRLIIADSHAEALVAYDIQDDGSLTGARTWAELDHAPDGICADADGAIWVASVPAGGVFGCVRAARCSARSPWIAGASPACSAATTGGLCSSPPPSGEAWTRWRATDPD